MRSKKPARSDPDGPLVFQRALETGFDLFKLFQHPVAHLGVDRGLGQKGGVDRAAVTRSAAGISAIATSFV